VELFSNLGRNAARVHPRLGGDTPEEKAGGFPAPMASLPHYRRPNHYHGLIQLPRAAGSGFRHDSPMTNC
jgi:hypothetical protein